MPALLALATAMHAESRFSRFGFETEKVRGFLSVLVEADDGFLWVSEADGQVIGALAATVFEHWFSRDRVAQDVGLFVRQDQRGAGAAAALVDRYLAWAQERGAIDAELGVNTGIHPERTGALLQRLGAREVGRLYSWEGLCA
ncbi:MAG: GNAT family N-acetyltransferase [Gammaproteobacteria bacterium]|nr:GNAT family N-acetyltransferase [Gammaproteobacteria bacterium]